MTEVHPPAEDIETIRIPRLKADESGGTERRDSVANRERILGAARQLFAERGVDNANMRDIAVTAGIGQGTLFQHKAALCEAVAADNVAAFATAVADELEAELTVRPAFELFRVFVDEMLIFIEDNGYLVTAM